MTGLAHTLPHRPAALLLDFDGVILVSAEIKTQAFAEVYAGEDPAKVAAVVAYQRLHGGVSRREKFAYFESEIFGRPANAARIDELAQEFARIAFRRVLDAPFVPGAEEFLSRTHDATRLYVISGTPQDELERIVDARGLARYFRAVIGAPTQKHAAFSGILGELGIPPSHALAVGDSITEYEAARGLGVPFLAVLEAEQAAAFPPDVPAVRSLDGVAEALGFRSSREEETG
jgi:phosphoglycolate phosphatase-like HAD superfamily hydrolase